MEPPAAPPPAAPPLTTTAAPPTAAYPDSIDSSPRSRNTDSWDDPAPPQQPPNLQSKLRLMCSYGGTIVPRPHDKSLCYIGGDTRMVVVDRNTSLASLHHRLSLSLFHGRPFTLKYQLPSEDLDSLISVTTDEDLENMVDEYDRTSAVASSNKSSRIRLFLFPVNPEGAPASSHSIGPIISNSAKSDEWFVNALNGSGMLNRGFSDTATVNVNCLLGLDDDRRGNNLDLELGSREVEGAANQKGLKQQQQGHNSNSQDVHSVPDSPMLETTSSFGSTSSSPSLANLPPIRVHAEDGGEKVRAREDPKVAGIEEQFAQITVSSGGGQKQVDEGFVVLSSPPPMPATIALPGAVPVGAGAVAGEYPNRVFSDDERSDHGVPVGYRKPPTPQSQPAQVLPLQNQQKSSGGHELPSPDSVSSDSSITNPLSRQKPLMYQEPVVQISSGATRIPANPIDPKINNSDPNSNARVQIQQQVPDSSYMLQQTQFDQQQQQVPQQQFIQAGAHYIHHHAGGAVPVSGYYPVYPSQQQHHPHHPQIDQQYPVYYVPARQPHAYNLPVQQQPSISDAPTAIPSSRSQTTPNPAMVHPAAYNAMRSASVAKPEMAAATGVYGTATTGTPQLVQVPTSQHQQQYVNYAKIHHPSQSVAPTSAATAAYAYEFADPGHAQIYFTQPLAPTIPSQYQTMTAAAAVGLPEASQLPTDNIKQQIRTSQPI